MQRFAALEKARVENGNEAVEKGLRKGAIPERCEGGYDLGISIRPHVARMFRVGELRRDNVQRAIAMRR